MLRALGIIIALVVASTPVDAQVFKPKSKKAAAAKTQKSESSDKGDTAPAAKKAKKQKRGASAKKRVAKKKKARAEQVGLSESAESAEVDSDYVKIWDDDEIE